MAMNDLWKTFEEWLEQSRPDIFNDLNGPAQAKDLASIAGLLSRPMPVELADNWMRHDGECFAGGFVFGGLRRLLSISDSIEEIERYTESAKRCGTFDSAADIQTIGPIQPFDWSSGWCPILLDNRVVYCVDLVPAPGGEVGQVIIVDHEALLLKKIATSFSDFFERGMRSVMNREPWPFLARKG